MILLGVELQQSCVHVVSTAVHQVRAANLNVFKRDGKLKNTKKKKNTEQCHTLLNCKKDGLKKALPRLNNWWGSSCIAALFPGHPAPDGWDPQIREEEGGSAWTMRKLGAVRGREIWAPAHPADPFWTNERKDHERQEEIKKLKTKEERRIHQNWKFLKKNKKKLLRSILDKYMLKCPPL